MLPKYEVELPDHGTVGLALVSLLRSLGNRALTAQEAYKMLAGHFGLDWKQLNLTCNTDERSKWENVCRSARNHLCDRGIMNRLPRDRWSLTERFRELPTIDQLGF
jgi:hypothetical protein